MICLLTRVKSELRSSFLSIGHVIPASTFLDSQYLRGPEAHMFFISWREKGLWFSCFQCHSASCVPTSMRRRINNLAGQWHFNDGFCFCVLMGVGVDGCPVTSVATTVCLLLPWMVVVTVWMARMLRLTMPMRLSL